MITTWRQVITRSMRSLEGSIPGLFSRVTRNLSCKKLVSK